MRTGLLAGTFALSAVLAAPIIVASQSSQPLAADIDLICTAVPDSYAASCGYSSTVVGQDLDPTNPPRDLLWPRIVLAMVILGIVLTLATTQLISPSRRYRKEPSGPGPDLVPLTGVQ